MWHPGLVQSFSWTFMRPHYHHHHHYVHLSFSHHSFFLLLHLFLPFGSSSHRRCKVLSFATYSSYFVLAKLVKFVLWTECGPVFVCIVVVDIWGILSLFFFRLFSLSFCFAIFLFLVSHSTFYFFGFFCDSTDSTVSNVTFVAAQHLESHCQTRLADSTRSPTNVQKPCCTYLVHVRARVTWQSCVYVGKEP